MYVQTKILEKWSWIHELNSEYIRLLNEYSSFKEEVSDKAIDQIN